MPERGIAGGREQAALVLGAWVRTEEGRWCGAERAGRVALKGALNSAISRVRVGPRDGGEKCKALGKRTAVGSRAMSGVLAHEVTRNLGIM